jgi:hypothetical protein
VYRDHYFCFTCNAHGSAIDWVIHHEQVRFADAAKIIADRIGVSLDERPVSRVAMQYAREEAEFCKWWWADRRRRLRASLDAALAEDDEMVAEFFGLRLRWSPAPAEAFRFFQMRRTDADRARWKNEMAEEKLFKDMWMALADGIGVRRAA